MSNHVFWASTSSTHSVKLGFDRVFFGAKGKFSSLPVIGPALVASHLREGSDSEFDVWNEWKVLPSAYRGHSYCYLFQGP